MSYTKTLLTYELCPDDPPISGVGFGAWRKSLLSAKWQVWGPGEGQGPQQGRAKEMGKGRRPSRVIGQEGHGPA